MSHRPLTSGEIALVHRVFGDSIDCQKVKIHCGKCFPIFQNERIAIAPFGSIYFPKPLYQNDFSQSSLAQRHHFIHEMSHVWQHQLGLPVWWYGICLALQGGYRRNACYAYQPQNCQHFNELNIEQQADFIADYFIFQHQNDTTTAIIQAFINNPSDRNLLPKSNHFQHA